MVNGLLLAVSALASLVPATVLPYRQREPRGDLAFWAVLLVAVVGPAVYSLISLDGAWRTGFAIALWVSITVTMLLYLVLSWFSITARRLSCLLMPFLLLMALLATVWSSTRLEGELAVEADAWLIVHIAVSVLTYACCTVAAIAGLSVFLQERAIKLKRPSSLSRRLPPIADAETLSIRLLVASEIVLALGIVSGMSKLYVESGSFLAFDHKTLLSLLAFALIGFLLILRSRTGLRGRRIARWIFISYLFLALAYPGVKFVTDVLLGSA